MSGDNEAESPFFRGRRKCVKFTQLCDVGRCTTNAIPLWVLVETRLEMLVDSYREDPQAHCAAQGTQSEMLVDSDCGVSWATQQDVRARCQQLVCRHAL